MRYGLIKKGICVSETETDNEKEAQRRAEVHGCVAVKLADDYGIGSKYTSNKWTEKIKKEKEKEVETMNPEERIKSLEKELAEIKLQVAKKE